MKRRFSISRLLLAVAVFAVPFAVLGGHGLNSTVLASIIGTAAAGAALLGKPQEIRDAVVAIVVLVGYVVLFGLVFVPLLRGVELGGYERVVIGSLFWLGAIWLALLLRRGFYGLKETPGETRQSPLSPKSERAKEE